MTTAYSCVLLMILFPYLFTVIAKYSANYNNHDPRQYLENSTGFRKRANYIQLNSFEALPAFGIAVIIAHLAHAPQDSVDKLAIGFVIARILYAVCYLIDKASLRSICWFCGIGCVIGLFYISY